MTLSGMSDYNLVEIIIENIQDRVVITDGMVELMKKASEVSFKVENFITPSEISILLVDNEKIREMNMEYRQIDKPTDVLSFPMVDMFEGRIVSDTGDFDIDEGVLLLGDIVISIETAIKQAEEFGHSFERELAFLLTHGVFHLLGYDHQNENEEKKMIMKQEAVLEQMGLKRK